MIPTDRYCHSGPSNDDNSILTKLSVMPFCHWGAAYCKQVYTFSKFQMAQIFAGTHICKFRTFTVTFNTQFLDPQAS